MKIQKQHIPAAVAVGLILCMMAYFALNLPFFTFEDPLARASLSTEVSAEGELRFAYDGDRIVLEEGASENATVYALTASGIAQLAEPRAETLSQDWLGSFAAVAAPETRDTNGDGVAETVYASAKTDMEFTQGYSPNAPVFLDSALPFEVAFQNRTTFIVYFQQQPLANAQIEITSGLGNAYTVTTDESGAISGIDTNDVRSGLTFVYRPGNDLAYTMHYQVEDNSLFTARHLRAMLPFAVILSLSALAIALDLFLRRRLYEKNGAAVGQAEVFGQGAPRARFRWDFNLLRWTVMAVSFFLLVYGARIAGRWFSDVFLPVFACPYNQDQLVGASCYTLSHLSLIFSYTPGQLLAFFGSLILSVVLLGRIFCGFICPMGFLQDIAHEARQALRVEGIALTDKLYAVLRLIKWVMLMIFLGIGFLGGNFCDFCPALALSPAFAGFQISLYAGGFMMVLVLVSGFFKRRLFCNVCPLGYLVGLGHRFSLFKLKKDCQACTECGACYEACPMGIKSIYTEREKTDITTNDCILCGECVRQCPEDRAIAITFCGKRVYTSSRLKFMERAAAPRKRRNRNGT